MCVYLYIYSKLSEQTLSSVKFMRCWWVLRKPRKKTSFTAESFLRVFSRVDVRHIWMSLGLSELFESMFETYCICACQYTYIVIEEMQSRHMVSNFDSLLCGWGSLCSSLGFYSLFGSFCLHFNFFHKAMLYKLYVKIYRKFGEKIK